MTAQRAAVVGESAQLPKLNQFLRDFWSGADLPPAQLSVFELVLEEVFANIVMHASQPGTACRVEVSLGLGADGVTMTVEDDGPEFDPLSRPLPDLAAGVAERPVGGLGVFLVRRMMDAVTYQRAGTRNRLTMTKSVAP